MTRESRERLCNSFDLYFVSSFIFFWKKKQQQQQNLHSFSKFLPWEPLCVRFLWKSWNRKWKRPRNGRRWNEEPIKSGRELNETTLEVTFNKKSNERHPAATVKDRTDPMKSNYTEEIDKKSKHLFVRFSQSNSKTKKKEVKEKSDTRKKKTR